MKKTALKVRGLALSYLKWGWPLLLADAAFEMWAGAPTSLGRSFLNSAAFAWVLCAPVAPISLLLDRGLRERAMARLCGLREGDERERLVTGEAARATLLLALSLQVVFLVLSLVSIRFVWNPTVPKDEKHGLLAVGLSFSSSRHLDPFGMSRERPDERAHDLGALEVDGHLLSPAAFSILALLILIQLAAFKVFALRRYEGAEA